ncbi:ATP-binding protein [Clostridium perfringens]|uniref:ATP-binding protein n=1 Tax=Clostridium perfringens TaxID=1502 RepID=UPI001A19E645|nr:ATP-binding protein [Clostridium perfringens]EJT6478250.1 sensor histidine kinase [Clostridium perfringens]MDK0563095.1 ATP-binding protein [Clostridium perfringens]MDK0662899.1 ATP-binding protein [Clostridium perfringens]MDK0899306.1 ATP-binding protein [Clostridium perfringens]MDM0516888.1 ATP-binding protein [Clostridium perfringens]
MISLDIAIREYTTIENVIESFKSVNDINKHYKIKIILFKFVALEVLPVIVALIKLKKQEGYSIELKIEGNNTYAQRIDFYRNLDIEIEENFERHESNGRFIEITKFNKDNNVDLVNSIIRIFRDNLDIDNKVLGCMNYCFFEVVDNVENHANSPIDGYLTAQRFPKEGAIRVTIVDCGIGIHKSLTEGKNEKYANLTESEALEYCVKEKVTNGKGGGNGLFNTRRFIECNKGVLKIYSGNKKIIIYDEVQEIENIPYFQGTIISLYVKMNNTVELEEIFGDNIPTTVEEVDDCIEELW